MRCTSPTAPGGTQSLRRTFLMYVASPCVDEPPSMYLISGEVAAGGASREGRTMTDRAVNGTPAAAGVINGFR